MIKKLLIVTTIFIISFSLTNCSNQKNISLNDRRVNSYSNNFNGNGDFSRYRYEFLSMINSIRGMGNKCSPPSTALSYNMNLEKAAMNHAKDMAFNHFLGHEGSGTALDLARKSPGFGSNFVDRIIFFGYPAKRYNLLGENVTKTKFSKLKTQDLKKHFKAALDIFVADPPHCKILMNPRFRDVGIGYYKGEDGYYWVVDFGETTK